MCARFSRSGTRRPRSADAVQAPRPVARGRTVSVPPSAHVPGGVAARRACRPMIGHGRLPCAHGVSNWRNVGVLSARCSWSERYRPRPEPDCHRARPVSIATREGVRGAPGHPSLRVLSEHLTHSQTREGHRESTLKNENRRVRALSGRSGRGGLGLLVTAETPDGRDPGQGTDGLEKDEGHDQQARHAEQQAGNDPHVD